MGNPIKHYTETSPATLGDPEHIKERIYKKAEEFATADPGWKGQSRFGMEHLKAARKLFSPAERAVERGLVPDGEPSQAVRAAAHQDELAAMYLRQGKARTVTEANRMANQAAPEVARLAGADPTTLPGGMSEGAKAYAMMTGASPRTYDCEWKEDTQDLLGQGVRRPPKLSDAQQKIAALTEQDVIELLVTVPKRGELVNWRPWLREWCFLTLGPYPVNQAPKGIRNVDNVNALNERLWQAARQERMRRFGYMD